MKRVKYALLAASFLLAMAFTVSCSSDDGDDGKDGVCYSHSGKKCVWSIQEKTTEKWCEAKNEENRKENMPILYPYDYVWASSCPFIADCAGAEYNTSEEFCFENKVYKKCGTSEYNPSTQFCDTRDSKLYKMTNSIGGKVWMAENLNYNAGSGSQCYNDITSNCNTYGSLYKWSSAKTACPSGWHLPSDAEWTNLTNAVGSNAGTKLKATSGWSSGGSGTDDYGFRALPGGSWSDNWGEIQGFGSSSAAWWSSTQSNYGAWVRFIFSERNIVNRDEYSSNDGWASVRCVRD